MSLETLVKDPNDDLTFTFTFAEFLDDGESVAGATVTDDPSGDLSIGTPTASGDVVNVQISGGTAGSAYAVECQATLSTGEIVNRRGRLKVRNL